MAALSDYLESGLIHHVFRGQSFPKPSNISVALTSGIPLDGHDGGTIPEFSSSWSGSGTGYDRVDLGSPVEDGNTTWNFRPHEFDAGSGTVKNSGQIIFNPALSDWGWVSGVAIVDSSTIGEGNLLMHAQLTNPRIIYTGDNVKFDVDTLEISFK